MNLGFLWIVAISINQGDLAERASQVKIMAEIYRRCTEVLVWFGEEEGETDSEMAIRLIEALHTPFDAFVEDGGNEDAAATFEQLEEQIEVIEREGGFRDKKDKIFWHDILRLQALWLG